MRPIHIIAAGAFGDEVASRLSESLGPVVVTRPGAHGEVTPAGWPLARVHILAAWRAVPAISGVLDDCAYAWRVPWLPILYEQPYLRIGPAVLPGQSGCYHCYRKRLAQHSMQPELTESLHSFYDANPTAGPQGHLPSVAGLAAATAAGIIARLETAPETEAGQLRQFDVLTRRMTRCHVVGVHGCPRCGLHRAEATRSYDMLLETAQLQAAALSEGRRP